MKVQMYKRGNILRVQCISTEGFLKFYHFNSCYSPQWWHILFCDHLCHRLVCDVILAFSNRVHLCFDHYWSLPGATLFEIKGNQLFRKLICCIAAVIFS